MIELKPSLEMHRYHKEHTLKDICEDILKMMAGYHTSYTGYEYLKDLKLLSKAGVPNKLAKAVLLEFYYTECKSLKLVKPE